MIQNRDLQGLNVLNQGLMDLLGTAARICVSDPTQVKFIARTVTSQRKAAKRREHWEEQGVHVPPLIIISITSQCNLSCKGCYARAQHRIAQACPGEACPGDASSAAVRCDANGDMDDATLRAVFDEARDLGISVALLAGGEPFTRPGLLDITVDYPDTIFAVFTNGTLIDGAMGARIRNQRNVIPVLSLEGEQSTTDALRGTGVWNRVHAAACALHEAKAFFGASLTVRSDTLDTLTDRHFIDEMISLGCRLFFFVEYVPVQPGTECWELTQAQRTRLADRMEDLKSSSAALFVSFPGDEEATGGCLAAGRGFVHISSRGDVEPCPFAPYSDTNIRAASLRDALSSPLLEAIRADHDQFGDTSGGCTLWRKREQVKALLNRR